MTMGARRLNNLGIVTEAAQQLRDARTELDAAMENARLTALVVLRDGAPEVEVAKALGVNRMTIRKWAGKL